MNLVFFSLLVSALETYPAVDPKLVYEASHHDRTRPDEPKQRDVEPNPLPAVAKFDVVPEIAILPIFARLKVTETLLLKYKRAYDYRIHTLPELQKILSELEEFERHPTSACLQ